MIKVIKRTKEIVLFNPEKIINAIAKAFNSLNIPDSERPTIIVNEFQSDPYCQIQLYKNSIENIKCINIPFEYIDDTGYIYLDIESIQDSVEDLLLQYDYKIGKEYIKYRFKRQLARESNKTLMNKIHEMSVAKDYSNTDNLNGNISDIYTMGWMLNVGSLTSKQYFLNTIKKEYSQAHLDGKFHIHDLDFYSMTTTCCLIDIERLLKSRSTDEELEKYFQSMLIKYKDDPLMVEKAGKDTEIYERKNSGFYTGHGTIRPAKSLRTAMMLTCIIFQSNQNDQYGGQGIPAIDWMLADFVKDDFISLLKDELASYLIYGTDIKGNMIGDAINQINFDDLDVLKHYRNYSETEIISNIITVIKETLQKYINDYIENLALEIIIDSVLYKLDNNIKQSCEGFVHNLCTMNSRAGSQVPFTSINYGTDTSFFGRKIIKGLLNACIAGIGYGETAIFPIQIFKVKKGVNSEKEDPNYDLFKLALYSTGKRLFPNYVFLDAPFNLQYYKKNNPRTEIASMGCRTRVASNVNGEETPYGRGNLSFITLNLPQYAIESLSASQPLNKFYEILDQYLKLAARQLIDRLFEQGQRKKINYPMLMGNGVWMDSDKLKNDDNVYEVLKHGTLSIGFIGLAETLWILTGKHHGESDDSQKLGLEIIKRIRDFCDNKTKEKSLNFSCFSTPAESTCYRLYNIDRKKFGNVILPNGRPLYEEGNPMTHGYYTNSNHIPVWYKISIKNKIDIEAPYHVLTNAGNICYVEIDGDASQNIDALEKIIKYMQYAGIGYGSINVPVDYHYRCGYTGLINLECPHCGDRFDEYYNNDVKRIRRITGYLVQSLDRFNDGKKLEEKDRIKHNKVKNS